MSATDELRRMLDERGVEWWPMHDIEAGYYDDRDTEFVTNGTKHVAHEWGRGLSVDMLTPEQAIAATLGSGTCYMEPVKNYQVSEYATSWGCVCSNCGTFHEFTHGKGWKYCPICRAEVVDA